MCAFVATSASVESFSLEGLDPGAGLARNNDVLWRWTVYITSLNIAELQLSNIQHCLSTSTVNRLLNFAVLCRQDIMDDSIPAISTLPPFLFASVLSTYGLYLCRQNITRLQQYEEVSEKAAEWSNTAAQRLHKTRTTQASGTLTVSHLYRHRIKTIVDLATASSLFHCSNNAPVPRLKT